MVVNLGTACGGPCAIGTNGILIIKAPDSDAAPGHATAAGATVVTDAQLSTGALPNDNTAVLLVHGSTAIAESSVLAQGDAGTATLPAGDSFVDGVGWGMGGGYAGIALTQSAGTPDAASRFPGRVDTAVSAWYNGDLLGTLPSGLIYDATRASSNLPAGASLTPGAPNLPLAASDAGDAGDAVAQDAAADSGDGPTAEGSGGEAATSDVVTEAAASDASSADAKGPIDAPSDAPPGRDDGPSSQTDAPSQADAPISDARNELVMIESGPPPTDGAGGSGGMPLDDGAPRDDAGGGSAGTAGAGTGGAGRAGAGGTSGAGGTPGTGGKIDAGRDSGASPQPPAGDDSGCGCRTAGEPTRGRSGLVLALLALGAFSRRRQKNQG
jgi:MYXO-CTERM domain-containing protein